VTVINNGFFRISSKNFENLNDGVLQDVRKSMQHGNNHDLTGLRPLLLLLCEVYDRDGERDRL
jgi:hypothetical protein